MKNNIHPLTPSVHAMTQNDGINPNSRWGRLMAASAKFNGDTEDYSRDVDDFAARVDAANERIAKLQQRFGK